MRGVCCCDARVLQGLCVARSVCRSVPVSERTAEGMGWTWWPEQLHLKDTGEELETLTGKQTTLQEKLAQEKEKVAQMSTQVRGAAARRAVLAVLFLLEQRVECEATLGGECNVCLWLGGWHQVEGITAAYAQEKEGYEAMAGEMEKTKAEFGVFERKDIKLKEDMKHLKAKDKKLKESIVKEQDKAAKARDSIPKQVPSLYLCVCLPSPTHANMHAYTGICTLPLFYGGGIIYGKRDGKLC